MIAFLIPIFVVFLTPQPLTTRIMKVLKFGGYAIDSAENILKVKDIVSSQKEPVVIVVSAFHGITDKLLELSYAAAARDMNFFRLHPV